MISSRQINNISDNFLILIVLIFLLLIFVPAETVKCQNKSASGLTSIIIDAGHGGKDPGAVVGKAVEKDIVLDIALRLGQLVRKGLPDVKVVYTRKGDYFVPLFKRSVIANNNKANLFISIHANYCESPSIKGTETYVLGLHRTQDNFEVEKKENSAILFEEDYSKRYEGFDPNSQESYIIFELLQDTHITQSLLFAGMVQDLFHQNAGRPNRDVRQAGFLVLREAAMPSVLIETGYLSNKAEAAYLMTPEGRETIASAIFNSIKNYKAKFDSRLNFASVEGKEKSSDKKAREEDKIEKEDPDKTASSTSQEKNTDKRQTKSIPSKLSNKKRDTLETVTPSREVKPVHSKEGSSISAEKRPDKKSEALNKSRSSQFINKQRKDSVKEPKNSNESSLISDSSAPLVSGAGKKADSPFKTRPIRMEKEKTAKKIADSRIDSQKENTYAIQIAASKVKLPKTFSLFKGISKIKEIEIGGYYKYYGFESTSKSKINESLSQVHQRIPDAFLVIFKDGVPIPLRDLQKKQPLN